MPGSELERVRSRTVPEALCVGDSGLTFHLKCAPGQYQVGHLVGVGGIAVVDDVHERRGWAVEVEPERSATDLGFIAGGGVPLTIIVSSSEGEGTSPKLQRSRTSLRSCITFDDAIQR